LEKEGDLTSFLGIKYTKNDNGSFTLTQSGLIQKILVATNMTDCNPNWTPASPTPVGKDPDGEPHDDEWSYPSVVGMLLYLSTNTRCDLCYAVSQVARFNHDPKKSHATAVKTIVRYLKRTADKGMIVHPDGTLNLAMYVDAAFCGQFGSEPERDANGARSRTGYILMLGGCPLIWKSQLQSSITLSTGEAEYGSLSASMRVLTPTCGLLVELAMALKLPSFEDNSSALILANEQRITSRTRYYLTKWHHFWSFVKSDKNPTGVITVARVSTTEQIADAFTKGLVREVFEYLRKKILGW